MDQDQLNSIRDNLPLGYFVILADFSQRYFTDLFYISHSELLTFRPSKN